MSKARFIFIEPHGDDAWLSASSILTRSSESLILTMSGRPSAGLSEFIHLGSECLDCTKFYDLPEIDLSLRPKIDTHAIHRAYKSKDPDTMFDIYESAVVYAPAVVEAAKLARGYLSEFLPTLRSLHYETGELGYTPIYVLPVGLDHPYHKLVSDEFTSMLPLNNILYYAEKPYTSKRYVREIMEVHPITRTETWSATIYDRVSLHVDSPEFKESVFRKVYPSEVGMLRFSSESLSYSPEEFFWMPKSDVERVLKEMKII